MYLMMGNMKPYAKIFVCAQLYVTILTPYDEFEVGVISLLYQYCAKAFEIRLKIQAENKS